MKSIQFTVFCMFVFIGQCYGDIQVPGDYPTIQQAVDAAVDGDTITVAEGVYSAAGNTNIQVVDKSLTIQSTGSGVTIDCESLANAFNFIGTTNTIGGNTLNGFNIINGHASSGGGIHILNQNPIFLNDITVNNCSAVKGGGLYSKQSSINFTGGGIYNCDANGGTTSAGFGGGIYIESYTILYLNHAEIAYNYAGAYDGGLGAGIYSIDSTLPIYETNIHHNGDSATCYRGLTGGGIRLANSRMACAYSRITDNSACSGGGIHSDNSTVRLASTVFLNNLSGSDGAAFQLWGSTATLFNCIFVNNNIDTVEGTSGSALWINSSQLSLMNCTLADNKGLADGGALRMESDEICTITNSIFWDNLPEEISLADGVDPNSIQASFSDIRGGGFTGTGNINSDPMFTSAAEGNYFLSQKKAGQSNTSPCVDAGSTIPELLKQFFDDLPYFNGDFMEYKTTRTDLLSDTGRVDLGYHYSPGYMGPIPAKGMELMLNDTFLTPGDLFFMDYYVYNPDQTVFEADIYIALDVWGQFFFYPTWTQELNNRSHSVIAGMREHELVFNFEWPSGVGSADNLVFWGLCCQKDTYNIVGDVYQISFSYAD